MPLPHSDLALVVYPSCLLWLLAILLPSLFPALKKRPPAGALIWWAVMIFGYYRLASAQPDLPLANITGYQLLPILAAAIASLSLISYGLGRSGHRLLLRRHGLGSCIAAAVIASQVSYWSVPLALAIAAIAVSAIALGWLMWRAGERWPKLREAPGDAAIAALLVIAAALSYSQGAVLIASALALGANGVLVLAAVTLIGAPHGSQLTADKRVFVLITAPAVLACEYALFGY